MNINNDHGFEEIKLDTRALHHSVEDLYILVQILMTLGFLWPKGQAKQFPNITIADTVMFGAVRYM